MKIAIRADASVELGSGHVMRCLTLARRLRDDGDDVRFLCRELPGDLCDLIEAQGFGVSRLNFESHGDWRDDADTSCRALRDWSGSDGQVDWLIVDHYALGAPYESELRSCAQRIMAIDDLADRPHDCDLLLDQNFFDDLSERYTKLVPTGCTVLLGPTYALLRPEFEAARAELLVTGRLQRDGNVSRILVFFGGSDPTGETLKVLSALSRPKPAAVPIDVVVGASNPRRDEVEALATRLPSATFHCQAHDMAGLMASADLALGAGGTATWERCSLGLPSLLCSVADNQTEGLRALGRFGAVIDMGPAQNLQEADWRERIEWACGEPAALRVLSGRALEVMGLGGDHRGADAVVAAMRG